MEPNTENQSIGGMHIGIGGLVQMGGITWFRAEMKYLFNPGVMAYFNFGFMFRFPEGGGGN